MNTYSTNVTAVVGQLPFEKLPNIYVMNTNGGNRSVALPAPTLDDAVIGVINAGSGTVAVTGALFNGSSHTLSEQYQTVFFMADADAGVWRIQSEYGASGGGGGGGISNSAPVGAIPVTENAEGDLTGSQDVPLVDPGNVWEPDTAVLVGYRIAETVEGELRVFEVSLAGTTGDQVNFTDYAPINITPLGDTQTGAEVHWRYLGIVGEISWALDPVKQNLSYWAVSREGNLDIGSASTPDDGDPVFTLRVADVVVALFEINSDGSADYIFQDGIVGGPVNLDFSRTDPSRAIVIRLGSEYFQVKGINGEGVPQGLFEAHIDDRAVRVIGSASNYLLEVLSETDAIGFYGATPVARPNLPASPGAQDIADVLLALGLVTQS